MVDLFPEGGGCAQYNTGRGKGVGVGTAVVADRSMALMGDPPLRRPDLFALLLLPPSYYSLYPLPFDPPPLPLTPLLLIYLKFSTQWREKKSSSLMQYSFSSTKVATSASDISSLSISITPLPSAVLSANQTS